MFRKTCGGKALELDVTEQEAIRQYLLGLAPEDAARVEERLFSDDAVYEELLIVEDELIEQYLAENLSVAEREGFQSHFLKATDHQRKLSFARALHKYADFAEASKTLAPSAEPISPDDSGANHRPAEKKWFSFLPFSNPIVAYSLAAAAVLLVAGISWVAFNNLRQQTAPDSGNVYLATLTPGVTRDGGELTRIPLTAGTSKVQFTLLVASEESQSYRAEVLTSEGASVASVNDLTVKTQDSERVIIFSISASVLKRDDYQVRLRSRQSDGTYIETARYQFRVIK